MATTVNSYKEGNTVRFFCEFKDFADQLADPSVINFKVYNQKYEQIHDASVGTDTKASQGNYFYDYTIPKGYLNQKLIYEWYGEVSGSPSLNRDSFKVVFM
jgi:hypothetical protein